MHFLETFKNSFFTISLICIFEYRLSVSPYGYNRKLNLFNLQKFFGCCWCCCCVKLSARKKFRKLLWELSQCCFSIQSPSRQINFICSYLRINLRCENTRLNGLFRGVSQRQLRNYRTDPKCSLINLWIYPESLYFVFRSKYRSHINTTIQMFLF